MAVAAVAGTSVVAHAYPTPKEHESIDCSRDEVQSGGSCKITYTDHDINKDDNPRSGQQICFSVRPTSGGTVTPQCTTTDSHGKAYATFTAATFNCSGDDEDDRGSRDVTIIGKEMKTGATARTTVEVQCKQTDKDKSDTSGAPTGGSGTTKHNDAAALSTLPAIQPTSSLSAVGILGAIVLVSVAITGRLRLRHRRR
ncbi:MAG: hypothetical protein JF886_12650 [Candidatus Dormibacteraeota bacterium]|uniref:Big-1 domain-containing protein n=2 Tax=Candidatus Aeolococcus gillhamiae TaxID=3127015 RepID=A0A934N0C6_9BACT|nr:hypothetical protein [Candidatus Dormibacteraeota bacterium]